jgi:ornithine cyclodeaminase/alanine dehydrogenase-like protein (mu-crystallin family)
MDMIGGSNMAGSGEIILLSDDALSGLGIGTGEVVEAIEAAIRAQAHGRICTARKSVILPGDGRYVMTTLSTSVYPGLTVVKSVTVGPRNADRGLKGIEGAIVLHDSETGLLRAIMGSSWVTAARTAGLSCVAAKRLANPNSSVIAFVGCGVEAHSHLDAFCDLFPLAEARAFGRGRANIERLCTSAQQKGLKSIAYTSPQEALDGADLVVSSVTISFDLKPFLHAHWLKPGAFAAITDQGTPWHPQGMDAFDTVIIDDLAQERVSERKMVDPKLVDGDLAELVIGESPTGYDASKRAALIFRGLAIGDFAVATLAYSRAMAGGKGSPATW